MLVYLVLIHIQYYTPIPVCYSTWYYYTLYIQQYTPIPVCQSTWYYYTYNIIHQYMYFKLPGITAHTIIYTYTCMSVYLILLHIQYYTPIPVCYSTWYYYTYNTIHPYLYASLPGITTHAILCTNTSLLVYLVLLHIQ
jgi:hypothetical protein